MIGSLPRIVAAVRTTLADLVLPDLAPDTWTAGSVRSSLTLLTYVEDALARGPDALHQGIAAIVEFIDQLLAMRDVSFVDAAMRQKLLSIASDARNAPHHDIAALDETHTSLKAGLSALIEQSVERGRGRDAGDRAAITALRDCLRRVSAAENMLAGRAGAMPSF